MKKKHILLFAFSALILAFAFSGCSKEDDGPAEVHPSYRDGTYDGARLEFTLNGNGVSTVKKVVINSVQISANVSCVSSGHEISSNPTYNTTIRIKGFPRKGKNATFSTVSDVQGFKGSTVIGNVAYDYVGEFTGSPWTKPEDQGLILKLTVKK